MSNPTVSFTCEFCGGAFESKRVAARFCPGGKCRKGFLDRKRGERVEKICAREGCGKNFVPRRKDQIYHHHSCRDLVAASKLAAKEPLPERTCHCGVKFIPVREFQLHHATRCRLNAFRLRNGMEPIAPKQAVAAPLPVDPGAIVWEERPEAAQEEEKYIEMPRSESSERFALSCQRDPIEEMLAAKKAKPREPLPAPESKEVDPASDLQGEVLGLGDIQAMIYGDTK